MKKSILAFLSAGMLSVSLHGYDQADRIKDMQTMAEAMSAIQKGILYNNRKMVLEGVAHLKKSSASVEIAPKGSLDFTASFAKKQSDNIQKYAEGIEKNIKEKHKHGAAKSYTKVLSECISCHNKIRKWN